LTLCAFRTTLFIIHWDMMALAACRIV
jgi:hypothetical protein